MPISKFEMYHGAVLTAIVRNPEISLKLIERDSEKHSWGMYSISSGRKDYVLLIKSTSKISDAKRTQEKYSNFTFSQEDIERLKKYADKEILVCLVCHDQHVCLLNKEEINELDILNSSKTCRISAYWRAGSELRVNSTFAQLGHKVPRNSLKNFDWGN